MGPDVHAVKRLECRLAGAHAVAEMSPCCPERPIREGPGQRTHAPRDVRSQPFAQWRVGERAVLLLGVHPDGRKRPQQPVQGVGVGSHAGGQVGDGARPRGQLVRHAEIRCDAEGRRDAERRHQRAELVAAIHVAIMLPR